MGDINFNQPPQGTGAQIPWSVEAIQFLWRRLNALSQGGGGGGTTSLPDTEIAFGSNTNTIISVPYFTMDTDGSVFSVIFPDNGTGIKVNDIIGQTAIYGTSGIRNTAIVFTGTGLNDLNVSSTATQSVTFTVTIDSTNVLVGFLVTAVTDSAAIGDTIAGTNTGATGTVYLINTDNDGNLYYYLTPLTGDFTGETDFTNSTNPSNFGTCDDVITEIDTYSWSTDGDSGIGKPCTTYPFNLTNNVSVYFDSSTGHTLGDSWSIVYDYIYGRLADFQYGNKTSVTIGDVDNLLNGGIFNLQQNPSIEGIRATIKDVNGSYLVIDSRDFIYQLGDIDYNNNGSYIEVYDNNQQITLNINDAPIAEFYLDSDFIQVALGASITGNRTYIFIDDLNQLITLTNVPTFANDSAAMSGGLQTGNLYKTTTLGITNLCIVP